MMAAFPCVKSKVATPQGRAPLVTARSVIAIGAHLSHIGLAPRPLQGMTCEE
jgi:hypothetical protein